MVDISDEECISYLQDFMCDMFCFEFDVEDIGKFLASQSRAREKLGDDELVEPNLKRLMVKRDKRIDDFGSIARECVESGFGSRVGHLTVNRNGGEYYEVCISLKKLD